MKKNTFKTVFQNLPKTVLPEGLLKTLEASEQIASIMENAGLVSADEEEESLLHWESFRDEDTTSPTPSEHKAKQSATESKTPKKKETHAIGGRSPIWTLNNAAVALVINDILSRKAKGQSFEEIARKVEIPKGDAQRILGTKKLSKHRVKHVIGKFGR